MLMEDAQKSLRIKKIKRDYSLAVSLAGAVFAWISFAVSAYNLLIIALICYCIACIAMYFVCNCMVRNIIMSKNWENLQKEINLHYIPVKSKKSSISSWWYALYLVPTAYLWYISIGASVNFTLILPVISVAVAAVMFLVHLAFKNSSQYADKKNIEKSIEDNIKFRKIWSVFILVTGIIIEAMLVILQLGLLGIVRNMFFVTAAPFALTVFATVAAVAIAILNNKNNNDFNSDKKS
jgi:hypothetical protein